MTRFVTRHAALAGVLAVVLAVVSFAVEGATPGNDAPADEVVEFYVDHDTQVAVGSAVATVAAALLVFFAALVREAIRRRDKEAGLLASVAFGGGVVAAAGITTDAAIRFALSQSAGEIEPAALQALFAFWTNFFWPIHAGLGLLVLGTSLAALGSRLLPSWLAWFGIVGGVLAIVGLQVSFVGLLFSALWVLITGVLLWRTDAGADPATT